MSSGGGIANTLLGGWTVSWGAVLQGGQPITLSCPSRHRQRYWMLRYRGAGAGSREECILTPTASPASWATQLHSRSLACGGPPDLTNSVPGMHSDRRWPRPAGWLPTQIAGPPFKRLDFSTFKDFKLNERFSMQFRAEFFNILNHPNFNAPDSAATGCLRFRVRAISPARTLAKLVRLAMLRTIRGRSSLL